MKTRGPYLSRALLTAGAFALMTASGAFASTPPCTTITNTATVAYSVGGANQTPVTSASDAANTFNVGVKVLLTVTTTDGNNVSVIPGATPAVLTFTVQNNGNAVHDYALAFAAATPGTPSPVGPGNDSFDGTTLAVYVESGALAGYQPLQDIATKIEDLAGDGATKTVYVVYTPTDLTAANGSIAVYYAKATTQWADGTAITQGSATPTNAQQATCNGAKLIDVVFGDGTGPFPSPADAARDGVHSDDSAFIVSSASIGVLKSYSVVSDPINGAVPGAKAIPGAVISYSIAIKNTGGSSALLTTISDTLQATNLAIDATAGAASWTVTGSTRGASTVSGTLTADSNNADGLVHDGSATGGLLTATMTTILAADTGYAAGELKTGETVTVTFLATVQ